MMVSIENKVILLHNFIYTFILSQQKNTSYEYVAFRNSLIKINVFVATMFSCLLIPGISKSVTCLFIEKWREPYVNRYIFN